MHCSALLVVPFFLATGAALAAGEPTVEGERSLAARAAQFAPVQSASADFAQEREVSLVDEVLRASGTLSLQAPEIMRLVLTAPEHMTLAADGATVTLLDAAGAPVPVPPEFSSFRHFARALTELLLGGQSPGRFFEEHWQGPDAVSLTPRDTANPFAEIALRFPPDGPLPYEIVLRERGGDRTIIRLTAIRLGPRANARMNP